MAEVLTIPRKLTAQGDLVVLPRSEYEKLLSVIKKDKLLDSGLKQALKEVRAGRVIGPFNNAKDLMKSLFSS